MKRAEGAMALAGPVTKYGLCSYCTVLSLRDSLSPGAPHSNGVTSSCKSILGSVPPAVSHAFLVEVCVEFVGAASAAKAEEEQAEDVLGCRR